MQVKSLDGVMHQVSPAEIERAYKMLPKHATTAHTAAQDVTPEQLVETFAHKSCKYKEKAEHNVKRIVQLENLPTTEDDMKSALAHVLRCGGPERIADALYETIQFQAARFMKHLVQDYME